MVFPRQPATRASTAQLFILRDFELTFGVVTFHGITFGLVGFGRVGEFAAEWRASVHSALFTDFAVVFAAFFATSDMPAFHAHVLAAQVFAHLATQHGTGMQATRLTLFAIVTATLITPLFMSTQTAKDGSDGPLLFVLLLSRLSTGLLTARDDENAGEQQRCRIEFVHCFILQ
jgi:hypothetical protein